MAAIAQRPGEGSEVFCYKIVIHSKTPGLNWPSCDHMVTTLAVIGEPSNE